VAPLDEALGVQPHQRSSGALHSVGCALAVCVPCATAATLLSWDSGGAVSPRAVWGWVQASGRRAMATLQEQRHAMAQGERPTEEPREAELRAAALVMGADGVLGPFRPEGGQPKGHTPWREITVGVLARVGRHGPRSGKVVARLHPRRVVAV
jgi:hypothetical protein